MNSRSLIREVADSCRRLWKPLALADVAAKCLAFALLTPLVGLLFRLFLVTSSKQVLADQDILFFFVSPLGWLTAIVVGGLSLGILALEQSALLAIVATERSQPLGVVQSLRFAFAKSWPVVRLTARLLAIALLVAAPFLLGLAATYGLLLGTHDINFYLSQRPPEFWLAVTLAGLLVAGLGAWLLRLASGWLFALPLVLFEEARPAAALRLSRQRASGQRLTIVAWLAGWSLATTALSGLALWAVISICSLFVPRATSSLELLSLAIGIALLLWGAVNVVITLLSTMTLAAIIFHLYRRSSPSEQVDVPAEPSPDGQRWRLTRGKLALILAGGVLLAALVGMLAIGRVPLEDGDVKVMAHRGASETAPENTLAAVRQAIRDGADWVEIDVQETADGEVVVFHDSDFMKLAGVDLKIWDATMADLADIDIGSWFDERFADQRVPTLAQVLDECQGKVGVNIELKYYGHDKQLERRVAEIVDQRQMSEEVVVMALSVKAVQKMKALRPNFKVGLLLSVSAGNLGNLDIDFLAVNASFVDRRFVRAAHRLGREVYVWTVNDPVSISAAIGRGVDALITDRPTLARSVIRQRAELSATERLLLELAELLGVPQQIAEQ